jgi:hypothetical protein
VKPIIPDYIAEQKLVEGSGMEVREKLLKEGLVANVVFMDEEFLKKKERDRKNNNMIALIVGMMVLLGLSIYGPGQIFHGPIVLDSAVMRRNEVMLAEIESQESTLQGILNYDLSLGYIPVSKELALLFRLSDLAHIQGELLKISDKINLIQSSGATTLSRANIAEMYIEMNQVQDQLTSKLEDKTHKGTIDERWFSF